ncbi:hypothetical protein JYT78_00180 [bacterium AH-315-I20]|nr:hypothetical protein [bacterium AH-315-I20]
MAFNKFRLLWGCIPLLLGLPIQAISACDDAMVGLDLDRTTLSQKHSDCMSIWASYSFYNQSFNIVEAENNSTTSQLTAWHALRAGINYPLGSGFKLRWYVESGSQQGTRVTEPKQVSTDLWGSDLRLQWSKPLFVNNRVGIEAGYRLHKLPTSSYDKLQQGNIFATAAPGKFLMDVSAKDKAWFVAGVFHSQITDNFSVHGGVELRDIEVQASTTSQDPLIQSLLEIQQVPQASPWQEKHMITNLGFDWQVFGKIGLSVDYKKYDIQRFNYQIRKNFIDYNESTQFDFYLTYHTKVSEIFFIHSRYVSNYLLGDTPALYNRRNNHTFKNPFGFITVGAQF